MRLLRALSLSVVGLFSLALPAGVNAWPLAVEGRPVAFDAEVVPEGLYLWVGPDDRLRVRVVGERTYRLSFGLHYGKITNIKTYGLDLNDHFEQSEDKAMLELKLSGSDAREGVDFSSEGNRVEVSCKTDGGDPCPLAEFYLGQDSANPTEVPFTISRKDDD